MTSTEYLLPLTTRTALAHGELADKSKRLAEVAEALGFTEQAQDHRMRQANMLDAVEADAHNEDWDRGYAKAAADWAKPWPTDPR